jgi:hypothetical protein
VIVFVYGFAALIDIICSIVIFYGMDNGRSKHYGFWHKLGRWILSVGMLFQAGRALTYISTGTHPDDLPMWIFKDLGIFIIVMAAAFAANKKVHHHV